VDIDRFGLVSSVALNFPLFHSFIEITAILIARVLVSMAFISRDKNVLVLRIGYLYSVVMVLDVLHTISLPGWVSFLPGRQISRHSSGFWVG